MGLVTPLHLLGAFIAAFLSSAINSVAGGGSMISFPILLAMGAPPIMANATNTAGIWSGALGSIWGFKEELARVPRAMKWLLVPAFIGGLSGAFLLKLTSAQAFDRIIPFLILFATVLLIVQAPIQKLLRSREGMESVAKDVRSTSCGWLILAIGCQLAVAVYGGYFGAGMSIMMLSVLGLIGMTDMLEMTALTSLLALAINGIAGVVFILSGLVIWPFVLVMAVGSILGGYLAAGAARRIGKVWIRRFVILVGLTLTVIMLVRVIHG